MSKNSLTIPQDKSLFAVTVKSKDLPEFFRLCLYNQLRIEALLKVFVVIAKAPTRGIGYHQANAALVAMKEEGKDYEVLSAATLRRLYSDFVVSTDWRCLIDKAHEWSPSTKMPEAFLDYLQEQVNKNKRSETVAIKKIRAAWTAGESIPGYGTWREHREREYPGRPLPKNCPGYPGGWHVENLRKKLDKSTYRRKANVQGNGAASMSRPLVLSTRAGCYVGSHYMWDDVWHDNFVNSLMERQAGRPLELFCHDYFSARKVRYGIRVRTEGDNGKMQGLTAKMMRMIVAATYFLDGYSPRGTVNVAEHGTAAFSEDMERTLYDHSGGLITVERSPMLGKGAHCGQYNGRRTGNPRFKASLESSNNIVHNLLGDVPGQTGPSVERRPEELHGLLTYNARVIAAMEQLSPARQKLLQFPLLEVSQFQSVLAEVYRFLEDDPDHDLEGWAECGHYTQDIHLMGEWRKMEELMYMTQREREIAAAIIAGGQCETRPRKLTRKEVWLAGCGDHIRMHGGTVCAILGDDFASERQVKHHQIKFFDKEVGPEEHRFEGFITDLEGRLVELKEKETYKCIINPFAPNHLLVANARGGFLGIANRTTKVTRGDTEALVVAMGHVAHLEKELQVPLAKQTHRENKKRLEMHRNNAAVFAADKVEATEVITTATRALTISTKREQQHDFEDAVLTGKPFDETTTTEDENEDEKW